MSESPHSEAAILGATLELPPERRAAYLGQVCRDTPTLRVRVEELIDAHNGAEWFLNEAPGGLDLERAGRIELPVTEKPGDKIGRYKLLQQIGEGGCGVVYRRIRSERTSSCQVREVERGFALFPGRFRIDW